LRGAWRLRVGEKLAQCAKQLAVCLHRPVAIALGARIACELAQVLAVGGRMLREQLVERRVALGDQALAPGFQTEKGRRCGEKNRIIKIVGNENRFNWWEFTKTSKNKTNTNKKKGKK